jgi:hypothetical protein
MKSAFTGRHFPDNAVMVGEGGRSKPACPERDPGGAQEPKREIGDRFQKDTIFR